MQASLWTFILEALFLQVRQTPVGSFGLGIHCGCQRGIIARVEDVHIFSGASSGGNRHLSARSDHAGTWRGRDLLGW